MPGPRRSAGTVCPPMQALAADQAITTSALDLKSRRLPRHDGPAPRPRLPRRPARPGLPPHHPQPASEDTASARRTGQTPDTRCTGAETAGHRSRAQRGACRPGPRQYGNPQRRAAPVRKPRAPETPAPGPPARTPRSDGARRRRRPALAEQRPDGGSGRAGGGDAAGRELAQPAAGRPPAARGGPAGAPRRPR